MIKQNLFGLKNTNFESPHGLDSSNHYTTAYELALLANYALNNEIFKNIVSTKSYTVYINNQPKTINNTNELLGNLNGVYGIKTGFTNGANRCLVSSCVRNDLDIICVVLGADTKKNRSLDSTNLINYCFDNYQNVNIKDIIDKNFNTWKNFNKNYFYIEKSQNNNLNLILENLEYDIIPIKKDDINNINIEINCNHIFTAPINKNAVVGNILVKLQDSTITSCNIIAENKINKKTIFNYIFDFIKNYKIYIKNSINI